MCVRGGDEFEKQARKRTCHSKTLCMPDSGCSSMAGKRGDGGLCEEAFDVSDGLLHDAWPHDALRADEEGFRHLGEERWGGAVGLRGGDV